MMVGWKTIFLLGWQIFKSYAKLPDSAWVFKTLWDNPSHRPFESHPSVLVLATDTTNPKLAATYVPLISHRKDIQVCGWPQNRASKIIVMSHGCLSPNDSRKYFDFELLNAKRLNSGAVHRLVFTISATRCSADKMCFFVWISEIHAT